MPCTLFVSTLSFYTDVLHFAAMSFCDDWRIKINVVVVVVVVVVSSLRMCQTHKHIQSNIKNLNEINDLIKNIEYRTMV